MKGLLLYCLIPAALTVLAFPLQNAAAAKPNFLIIMADDCTYNDLSLYGGQNAKTPHIDQLAERGLVFDQAYLCSAMCQPCRAELFTGLYPMKNGCTWNHSACRTGTLSLPHHLGALGYRVALSGKTHLRPESCFPFEYVAGFDKSCVRDPTREADFSKVAEFINRNPGEPFCLVVALVEPHVPWVMGDASQYPPKKIKLPPNLADTQLTREHFADYLAEITFMDTQVGEILRRLEDSGRSGETLVLFTSEQGSQFPGCKWTNWNTGLHTALVASWPGKIKSGTRTSALVQYADITPTLVDLAQGDLEGKTFDGSSFRKVLIGESRSHRDYVYGMHNNVPEGPPYPIRSISNGTYRYIRNLRPGELYIEKHLMGGGRLNNPYFATWLGADPANAPVYQRVKRYMLRPAEQIYRTTEDPYELNNLAGSDETAQVKGDLRAELDRWMRSQGDPGVPLDDVESLNAARKLQHRF